jgi:hypothetical protein
VLPVFQINLHERDLALLESLQAYFGGIGSIYKKPSIAIVSFMVSSLEQISNVISHFDKYPLITQKQADYQLFKQIIQMISRKEHLTALGLQAIVNIRASLNRGLLETLKKAFPNTVAVKRPLVDNQIIPHFEWVAGFTSAEGCFLVRITKAATHRSGHQVFLIFKLTQHIRDEQLIRSLVDYLGCGKIYEDKSAVEYRVTKFSDLTDKILPLFEKYPIQGIKHQDYTDFILVVGLIKEKKHLTEEGLNQIIDIKTGMNRMRS